MNSAATARTPWYRVLYVQVLIAIALGVVLGYVAPETAKSMKWLGDGFIALIKMMIAPVIFCTVVHGIASMGDLKTFGRVGLKTLVYFEVVSTFALLIGLPWPRSSARRRLQRRPGSARRERRRRAMRRRPHGQARSTTS